MHVLICGGVGVGKSTLINRLLRQVDLPVYGFRTKKTAENAHVYIYPAGGAKVYAEDNMVGIRTSTGMRANPRVFEDLGVRLLTDIPAGSIVLMDELGFLESAAPTFCRVVENVLDGPYFVLAAVKPLDTDFLSRVRRHKNALRFDITSANRGILYEQILAELQMADPSSPFLPSGFPLFTT